MADLSQLLEAVKGNDAEEVERLLDADPRLAEARTETGVTAVLMAAYAGADEALARLLDRRSTLDVYEAAALGRAELVRESVEARPETVSAIGADGWTALHLAAFFGHRRVTAVLLELGADPAVISANPTRNTPLHAAIAGRRESGVIDALLEAGSPVDVASEGGYTPLHLAASRGERELADRLVALGASAAAESAEGKAPADIAEEYGHAELARHLRSLAEVDGD